MNVSNLLLKKVVLCEYLVSLFVYSICEIWDTSFLAFAYGSLPIETHVFPNINYCSLWLHVVGVTECRSSDFLYPLCESTRKLFYCVRVIRGFHINWGDPSNRLRYTFLLLLWSRRGQCELPNGSFTRSNLSLWLSVWNRWLDTLALLDHWAIWNGCWQFSLRVDSLIILLKSAKLIQAILVIHLRWLCLIMKAAHKCWRLISGSSLILIEDFSRHHSILIDYGCWLTSVSRATHSCWCHQSCCVLLLRFTSSLRVRELAYIANLFFM
jgi:hypothetical protein